MRIFYIITKIICFPGAYMRGFWEQLTCRILRLQVEPTGYMRMDEACGHVEHSLSKTQFSAYLMATGPGFMNFNIGFPLFLFGYVNLKYMGITPWDSIPLFIVYIISMYVGVSMLCCCFPLTEDIINYLSFRQTTLNKNAFQVARDNFFLVLGFPFTAVTRVGAFLESTGILFILWVAFIVWSFVS